MNKGRILARAPGGQMRGAATQAMRGHRRGAATKQMPARPLRGLTGSRRCRMLQIFTATPDGEVRVFLQPWQLLLGVLAGWVHRQQQDVIEYLLVENRVLR
jgi:hypothetical protein